MEAVSDAAQDPLRPPSARELVVYGAAGCHLCGEAMELLRTLAPGLGLTLRYVTIEGDPELEHAHRREIPVGFLGGRKVFKYRVAPARLRRAAARRGHGVGGLRS